MKKEIAECIGLWLAEGDNKTAYEITFTNNCLLLVMHFKTTIENFFKNDSFNPRVYVYSPTHNHESMESIFLNCKINYYTDKRANKPYMVYRIASVKLVKEWKKLVLETLTKVEFFADILRGFFAGEGTVHASKYSKTLGIAQAKRLPWLEGILIHLGITKFRYDEKHRSYEVWRRENWDIFNNFELVTLHPDKNQKFKENYAQFKEYHYPPNFLKENIYKDLVEPKTCKELATKYNRKASYVVDPLNSLKKENKIINFRVKSFSYWLRTDINTIIISQHKKQYLDLISDTPIKTGDVSKMMKVNWKAANMRLKELENLGLIKQLNYQWTICKKDVKIIVI